MQVSQKLLIFTAILCCVQAIEAGVLFRFSLDFHVGDNDNSTEDIEEHMDRAILFTDEQLSFIDNTTSVAEKTVEAATIGPVDDGIMNIWAQQHNLNEVAAEKLKSTLQTMRRVNQEIRPVVGRSDSIAAKAKLINFYLNRAEAASSDVNAANKFLTLRRFVRLIEELYEPLSTDDGGERSLEFLIMKLALDKHNIRELQKEVNREVLLLEESWQRYVKEHLVEVVI